MRRAALGLAALLVSVGRASGAQRIPGTIVQAEVDGAAFTHEPAPTEAQDVFAHRRFGGTSDRRCVASISDDSLPGGSLRSGEIIARARFTGRWGLHAGEAHKILWFPLHRPASGRDSLVLRAARIGRASDSLRFAFPGPALSGAAFGFPSTVTFPGSGQWLVVVTTGPNWGCFVLRVASVERRSAVAEPLSRG